MRRALWPQWCKLHRHLVEAVTVAACFAASLGIAIARMVH